MDEILCQIIDSDNWPSIQMPENLELLNKMADNNFNLGTFEGKLAATLMYHQILEAMCIHLLENCHFFIQLSVYPSKIDFKVPKDKMLGYYLSELKASVSFPEKREFIEKAELFNSYRIEVVHKMRKSNLDELTIKLTKIKNCFDQIYDIYEKIQDNFRVTFHNFKKDVFVDYLSENEYKASELIH